MSKSTAEIYTECTRVPSKMEEQQLKEQEHQLSVREFAEKQSESNHVFWLNNPSTASLLFNLEQHLQLLKKGFENFGDNFHTEESMKSAGIQAIKLSVAIKQLTKVINYVRTNNISELK